MSTLFQERLPEFAKELRELCERHLVSFDADNCLLLIQGQATCRCDMWVSYNGVKITDLAEDLPNPPIEVYRESTLVEPPLPDDRIDLEPILAELEL